MPAEEEILALPEDGDKGWIMEVNLDYPEELHGKQNNYPLATREKGSQERMDIAVPGRTDGKMGLKAPKDEKRC